MGYWYGYFSKPDYIVEGIFIFGFRENDWGEDFDGEGKNYLMVGPNFIDKLNDFKGLTSHM